MSNLIYRLEKQGKRECYSSFALPAREEQAQWKVLQHIERQATEMQRQVSQLLPPEVQLVRHGVKLTNYRTAQAGERYKLRAQLSMLNHGHYLLRLHCHLVDLKGAYLKIARADYHYREKPKN